MIYTYPTLFSRDSRGDIIQWSIQCVQNEDLTAKIVIKEGITIGTKTISERNISKGKNIGKINQTTPYQQALSESESRWNKKLKQGYKNIKAMIDIKSYHLLMMKDDASIALEISKYISHVKTDDNENLKPMKAQSYFKDNGEVRIKFPCYGQPKLNGFRCMARVEETTLDKGTIFEKKEKIVVFRSKEGLRYDIFDGIIPIQLLSTKFLISSYPDLIKYHDKLDEYVTLDGEMYVPNLSLQRISSAVRKRNNDTSLITFYVFDLALLNLTQSERFKILDCIGTNLDLLNENKIKIVKWLEVFNNDQAQTITDEWIKEGYEGGIFRDKKSLYKFGHRASTMVKLKRHQDKEFIIVNVVPGDNSPELGIFVCRAENGLTFKVTPEGNHIIRKEYLINKPSYIGKKLTVKFFERTDDGLPFQCVGTAVRDYE